MKTRLRVITAVSVLAAGGLAAYLYLPSAAPDRHQTTAATIADGARIYAEHCAACHGANLEGQPNWRIRLPDGRLPAPPHDASGHTWHHPDQLLFAITKQGTKAMTSGDYKTDMRGFGDVLSDREIWSVLDYIKSRWPTEIQQRQSAINARQRK